MRQTRPGEVRKPFESVTLRYVCIERHTATDSAVEPRRDGCDDDR